MIKKIALIAGIVALAGTAAADPLSFSITMQREACYGTCPVYSVKVDSQGSVEFDGIEHVQASGKQQAKVDPAEARALLAEIEAAGFFSLPEGFESKCGAMVTDLPQVSLSVERDGRKRTIVDYHGCRGNADLEKIRKLEPKVDQVLGTKQWVGPRPMP